MVERITGVRGRGIPLRGADVDTDRIIPGRFLKTVTFDGLERHVFEDDRKAGAHPFDDPRFQGASVLIVNSNFGCGSSREHAPQALQRWGVRAIVGESFAEIFFGNSMMIGLPCVTAPASDIATLMELVERDPLAAVALDLAAGRGEAGNLRFAIGMPPKMREALLTGAWDTTGMLLDRYDEVNATAARLPYVAGF